MADVVAINQLKNHMNQKFSELDKKLSGIGGGGLKYKELDFNLTIPADSKIEISENIGCDALLITTMYFESRGYFGFKIFDSVAQDKFKLYGFTREKDYSDSIMLLYSDKENLQNLNLEVKNYEPFEIEVNIKILGIEISK